MMRTMRWVSAMVLCLVGSAALGQTKFKTEEEIKAEDLQAQALYGQQKMMDALPLYEDLHVQRPQSVLYDERLGFVLLGAAVSQPPAEAAATRERARQLLLQAKAGGDNSNLLVTLLEKLGDGPVKADNSPKPPGYELMQQGEVAFGKGDLEAALGFYTKAFEQNPQLYYAALFAGDTEFKRNHPAEAGVWFAKAIAIDPDIETAHRYWGDSLEKAGEHQRAEEQFVLAIVADPYSRSTRLGLKQWADKNHAMLTAPPITLPARATKGEKGNINITLDAGKKDDPEMSLTLIYSMKTALWQGDEFKKHFPDEKVYRHSLAEEADCIRGMLAVAKEQKISEKKLSTSTRLLMELDRNGMLESWILLDHADQGIAQDYVAYRKDHRDLMAKYIAQYDVHAM
jgi:tetratricopeptide (TPR) repeat protein